MSLRDSQNTFIRRTTFVATIRAAGLLCVFALQVLLARLVDDSVQYGSYAWGQSLLFMAGALACMGLPTVAGRFIASLGAHDNQQAIAAIHSKAIGLLLRSSAVLVLIALLISLFWHEPPGGSHYRNVAILALLCAPAVSFANLYQDLSRARQWLGLALLPFFVFRPLLTAVLAVACWVLLQRALGATTVLGVVGLSLVVVVSIQAMLYHQREQQLAAATPHTTQASLEYHPSRLFVTAMPVFFTRCAGLVITYSNVLLVGFLAGPAAAGAYFAAERLAQLASIPAAVVAAVNQQAMAGAHASEDAVGLQKITTQSAHGSLWPTLAVGVGLVVLSNPLLQLFHNDFADARTVLIALVASNVVAVLMGPAQDVLIMTGRQRKIPRVMFISAAVHVISLVVLVPQIGALGAALSSIASGLVANIWLMSLAKREAGISTTILGKRAA